MVYFVVLKFPWEKQISNIEHVLLWLDKFIIIINVIILWGKRTTKTIN